MPEATQLVSAMCVHVCLCEAAPGLRAVGPQGAKRGLSILRSLGLPWGLACTPHFPHPRSPAPTGGPLEGRGRWGPGKLTPLRAEPPLL